MKFLRALSNILKKPKFSYSKIFLRTFVSQNQPDDDKKRSNLLGFFSADSGTKIYYKFLLESLRNYEKSMKYKPFLKMATGLHELSEIFDVWGLIWKIERPKIGKFTNLMGDFDEIREKRRVFIVIPIWFLWKQVLFHKKHIFELLNNPFEMDDFSLDELRTENSEYIPDIDEIPINNRHRRGLSGFRRLRRRKI